MATFDLPPTVPSEHAVMVSSRGYCWQATRVRQNNVSQMHISALSFWIEPISTCSEMALFEQARSLHWQHVNTASYALGAQTRTELSRLLRHWPVVGF